MRGASRTAEEFGTTQAGDQEQKLSLVRRSDRSDPAALKVRSDVWNLCDAQRPHERDYQAKVNFTDLPEWLRDDAKRFVAYLYEEVGKNLQNIQTAMVALRRLGHILSTFNGPTINLHRQHALEVARYLRSDLQLNYAHRIKADINKFMAFIRRTHLGVTANDFHVVLPKRNTKELSPKPLGKHKEDIVETDISAKIINACMADLKAYRDYMKSYIDPIDNPVEYQRRAQRERRRRLREGSPCTRPLTKAKNLLSRAIKGQALILCLCVGRRAAAICITKVSVQTKLVEWVNEEGQTEKGTQIRFRETKITNAYEDVFCPDALGEIALRAIKTAKALTVELRRYNPQLKEFLFLVPARQRNKAQVLSPEQMNDYINGDYKFGNGLLQRHEIPSGRITTHMFRRTRATNAWVGGMQEHEVSRDLGHLNVDTTLRHYIAGNEESRRRFQVLVEHGALSDTLQKLSGGVELLRTAVGRRQVEVMRRQGLVLRPNRYGCCALGGSGHCVKTTACYLGPEVESGGCEYHVLTPDALPALEEDKETLEASIALNSDYPGCRALIQSMRNQMAVVDRNIELARTQQSRVDNCEGSSHCGCKPRAERGTTVSDE